MAGTSLPSGRDAAIALASRLLASGLVSVLPKVGEDITRTIATLEFPASAVPDAAALASFLERVSLASMGMGTYVLCEEMPDGGNGERWVVSVTAGGPRRGIMIRDGLQRRDS